MSNYCYNCMKSIKNEESICPHCGKLTIRDNLGHQLKAGTMLHDRYLIGKVLGQGGFGIT